VCIDIKLEDNMYQIELDDKEMKALAWATNRGYFPAAAYDGMYQSDEDPNVWVIKEPDAWTILDHIQEQDDSGHSWFPCLGGSLLDKLIDLTQEIV
jgi:hypothetical protein